MPALIDQLGTGVITGDKVTQLFAAAKKHGFAIPALSVNSSSTANCSMEAAAAINSPIILQVSNKSAAFVAGGSINNNEIPQLASIAGAVAMALHVRQMAKFYGIPVVLNSLHCSKELLPWLDGMLEADEEFFEKTGEPLFSSHTLDLSEEEDGENISICKSYLERMAPMKLWLEMEIGIMGGEEDGVENSGEDQKRLYTQPEQIWAVHEALSPITPNFSIAAAFGNIHSSHNPGNVKLKPDILVKHQEFVKEKLGEGADDRPCIFVFRGGSGSSEEDMAIAVKAGVVKMNVDTDMQWAYWEGVKNFYKDNEGYLQGQIGNPDGEDKPNKKYYDPRVWIRKAEENMRDRVKKSCEHLGNVGTLAKEV